MIERISMNIVDKVKHIKTKFFKSRLSITFSRWYHLKLSIYNESQRLVYYYTKLLDENKPVVLIDNPFCANDENKSKIL